jgi:hypothetical protein
LSEYSTPPALPSESVTASRASSRCVSPSSITRLSTVVPSTFASTQLFLRTVRPTTTPAGASAAEALGGG